MNHILNTSGALLAYADFLKDFNTDKSKEHAKKVYMITNRLIDEIQAQRQLLAAENSELKPSLKNVNSVEVLNGVAFEYEAHPVAHGKKLVQLPDAEAVEFKSDPALVSRVVGNMVKNAFEASDKGGTVTMTCHKQGNSVVFSVHNSSVMPRDIQLQLFQRSFTTKGEGRGIGTYSMKLLTERYLNGKIAFESAEGKGTTFTATYPI